MKEAIEDRKRSYHKYLTSGKFEDKIKYKRNNAIVGKNKDEVGIN
jgi:hypothetical protein